MAAPFNPAPPRDPVSLAAAYLDLLAYYGREISLTLEVPRIYELAIDGAQTLTGAPSAALCARPPEGGSWQLVLSRGLDAEIGGGLCQVPAAQFSSGRTTMVFTVTGGKPELPATWRDIQQVLPGPLAAAVHQQGLDVLLSLPFEQEGPALLHLLAPASLVVPPESLAAVRMLLGQASVALRNARLYFQGTRWAQRLALLQATGTEIGATLHLNSVLTAAVRRAVDLVAASTGVLALWQAPNRQLVVAAATGVPGLLDCGTSTAHLGTGLAGRAAQERRVLVLPNYQGWEYAVPAVETPPIHGLVALPLLWQDDLLGVLEVGDYRADRVFTDEDVSLLLLLGQQTASAIANARLYERAQGRLHQLTVLQDTSRAIISQLDYDQVLRTVLRNASSLLGTQMGAVFVPDEKQEFLTVRAAVGLDDAFIRNLRVGQGDGPVGRVLAAAKTVAVHDVHTDPLLAAARAAGDQPPYASILAVPLISQGRILGALCVYGATPRHWSPVEAELLLVFASQAANAMQNILLFERLRAEKATLTTTIQSMSDGLVITDADGDIILANPVADQMFNVPFTASLGMNLLEVLALSPYPMEYRTDTPPADLLGAVLGQGSPYHGELDVRGTEHVTLEFSFLPVIGVGYIITGGLAVFHDITQLRRLNDLKTDFISMVSHELRTPLTSIKGFVKLVLVEDLGPLTPQQRECLTVADGEADRLTHLINDLLDITRIEAGRMMFSWEVLNPGDLIQHVMEVMRPQVDELQLHLDAALPAALPAIRGDRQRINQILTNLVANAVKFTPPGGQVQLSAVVESGALVVRVADTGVGIPDHALGHIFDRFYQVDAVGARA
ncbi:MAG TPA: GAF domain-containing protein, partial [Chloroflexia bacterium]|nr:GAF domain-containing protein [Chloroflexia bacterium]